MNSLPAGRGPCHPLTGVDEGSARVVATHREATSLSVNRPPASTSPSRCRPSCPTVAADVPTTLFRLSAWPICYAASERPRRGRGARSAVPAAVFASVSWSSGLALMCRYCYLLLSTADCLPVHPLVQHQIATKDLIRSAASSYILVESSRAVQLRGASLSPVHRRAGVPGLEVGSSLLFSMSASSSYLLLARPSGSAGSGSLAEVFT